MFPGGLVMKTHSLRRVHVLLILGLLVPICALAQEPAGVSEENTAPLAAKEQMIRDRFERFQDRIYRLSEELAETEPENAARLARALSRAGEMGLADQLDEIKNLLNDSSSLNKAVDAQNQWLADADRLLSILLERDSQNEERQEELERLEQYRKAVNDLLEQERGLRAESAQSTDVARLKAQIDQAISRLDAIMQRQAELNEAGKPGAEAAENTPAEQERLAKDAKELAKDLERLSKESERDSDAVKEAKEKTAEAGASTQKGSEAMSQAGPHLHQGEGEQAGEQQSDDQE